MKYNAWFLCFTAGLTDQGESRPLELRDPIAVENSGKPVGKHNSSAGGGWGEGGG